MKKFSEFASKEDCPPEGDRIHIHEVLGKPILIYQWVIKPSKKKEDTDYATIQLSLVEDVEKASEGETPKKYILFTGSQVLLNQLQKYNVPEFETTIIKRDKTNYFTFS